MAVKIGETTYLNMPEQVAKNQSDIKKLADQYDMLTHPISDINLSNDGDLIFILSNGETVDAGLVKSVSNFSIDASQHLIITYIDGSTEDLGAIFSGNISVSGNLTVSSEISGNAITGNSIIENMSGYSFNPTPSTDKIDITYIYAGVVKNGNKITFALAFNITNKTDDTAIDIYPSFLIPNTIAAKLNPTTIHNFDALAIIEANAPTTTSGTSKPFSALIYKSGSAVVFNISSSLAGFQKDVQYYVRVEQTFLLSDNLVA